MFHLVNWVCDHSNQEENMAHPIIIQESSLRNYLSAFRDVFRPAQWTYFETVLMGLIHCQSSRTLSGMLRTVAVLVTVGKPFPGQSTLVSGQIGRSALPVLLR
jgi:hypothetical protein